MLFKLNHAYGSLASLNRQIRDHSLRCWTVWTNTDDSKSTWNRKSYDNDKLWTHRLQAICSQCYQSEKQAWTRLPCRRRVNRSHSSALASWIDDGQTRRSVLDK